MQVTAGNRKLFGSFTSTKLSGDLQPYYILSLFISMHHKMLEIFLDFAVLGAGLEECLK